MVRRKNSAEMLDVLRRVAQEEKARRLRQAQRNEALASGADSKGTPDGQVPAPDAPGAVYRPASRQEESVRGIPSGFPETNPEGEAPGRFRRSFLSVLSGGRSSRAGFEEPASIGASPDEAQAAQPPSLFGVVLPAAASVSGSSAPALPAAVPYGVTPTDARHRAESDSRGSGEGVPAGADRSGIAGVPRGLDGPGGEGETLLPSTLPASPATVVPAVVPGGYALGVKTATPWSEDRNRPLFGEPAEEGGWRTLVSKAARVFWGDGISGGLRQRVEVKVATLGVYAAVALAAMLAVALIMNQGGGDRREKLLPGQDPGLEGTEEGQGRVAALPVENLPPGRGPGTEIRNVLIASEMEPAPAAKDSRSFETVPAAESATPATAPAGEAKVFTGDPDKAPRGWYVQIQSMVSPEHAELMIDHVRSLGFNSFWKRPMLESQPKQKSKIPQWWILRLGPYPTLPAAEEEKARFLRAIEKTPLKKPKGIKWAPFVPKGENP